MHKCLDIFDIFQDMLVPIGSLEASIQCFDELVQIYPIWLCPFKLPCDPGMVQTPSKQEEL